MLCARKIRIELSARVGLPPAAKRARPSDRSHTAATTQGIGLLGFHDDGNAHTVAVPLREHAHAQHSSNPTLVRRQLVRGHHRRTFPVAANACRQRLRRRRRFCESKIVIHRRPQPLAARLERHVVRPLCQSVTARRCGQRSPTFLCVESAEPGTACSLLASHDETRVAHAQRLEQSPLEDHAQRSIVKTGNQEAEEVGRESVVKAMPQADRSAAGRRAWRSTHRVGRALSICPPRAWA